MTIEEAPLKRLSPERLSAFQADTKCPSRSWKTDLSILISAMVKGTVVVGRDVLLTVQALRGFGT